MNHCQLIGRLTKDPELKFAPNSGTAVSTITLAVNSYAGKDKEQSTDFIPVVIWGKQAENASQYLNKGSEIAVSGRIKVRNYEAKDGSKRYVTEIIADPINGVQYLGKKSQNNVDSNIYDNSMNNENEVFY